MAASRAEVPQHRSRGKESRNSVLGFHAPVACEFPISANQGSSRLSIHEQFRHRAVGKPLAISANDLGDTGRLVVNGDLARSGQRGATALSRLGKRTTIVRHLFFGEISQERLGEQRFDKEIVFQNHLLSCR